MQLKYSLLTSALLSAFALTVQASPDASWPTSDQIYEDDVTLPGYGDISQNLTLSGNKNNTLTISDSERGAQPTLSVTQGTTTFKDFDRFVLHADHSGHGDGYGIQGLYVLSGGRGAVMKLDNIRSIELGTNDQPLLNTYAVTVHSGEFSATNFESFSVRSSNGLWATNSGGESVINVDGGDTGTIDIQTTSFAICASSFDNSFIDNFGINLKGKQISLKSENRYAVGAFSGAKQSAMPLIDISASDSVLIEGATDGIYVDKDGEHQFGRVQIQAGNTITVRGGENAINVAGATAADEFKLRFNAPVVAFEGNVNAADAKVSFLNGDTNETPTLVRVVDGDFLVGTLQSADALPSELNLESVFNDEVHSINIDENQAENSHVSIHGKAIDELTQAQTKAYLEESVDIGKSNYDIIVENPAWTLTESADADGNVTTEVRASDLSRSTLDLAEMTMVAWRNETTTLTDRMATLHGNTAEYGAWVRWNGGSYEHDARSLSNDFNTIEVGVDHRISPAWTLGASFSYTKGDGDFLSGETDSDAYAGALYALWTHEKGSFVDVVAKAGRLSSDFDFRNVNGVDSGSLDQTGFIFGVETGHRFALAMNSFVEPQVQLTYSVLGSANETTSQRHIDIEKTESLIGRVGVLAGIACPDNRGSAYVRVSALHDFQGDVEGSFRAVNNTETFTMSEDLGDTWFEFGIGADMKVSKNAFLFADIQKSAGGDIDLDWRANIGAKLLW